MDAIDRIIYEKSRSHAQYVEHFIITELHRKGIGHWTPEAVRDNGFALEVREGTYEPLRLIHEPMLDRCIQLADY